MFDITTTRRTLFSFESGDAPTFTHVFVDGAEVDYIKDLHFEIAKIDGPSFCSDDLEIRYTVELKIDTKLSQEQLEALRRVLAGDVESWWRRTWRRLVALVGIRMER